MKSLSVLALLAVVTSSAAYAVSPAPIYVSNLSQVRLSGTVTPPDARGTLKVNELKQFVILDLFSGSACPPNVMCIQGLRPLVSVKLPITDVARNPDGSRVVTASMDARTRDGALQKLVIMDRGTAGIQGRYLEQFVNRSNGQTVTKKAEFNGTQLKINYSNL